jgi:pSer/pThr/pTyr-binding forkhead associated (FHA) protein
MERTQPAYDMSDPMSSRHDLGRTAVQTMTGTRLTGLDGPVSGLIFLLRNADVHIGRDSDSDVALTADPTVSRLHAQVLQKDGVHVLVDAGSSNGTFVNGVAVHECILAIGDVIQIGGSRFRYE